MWALRREEASIHEFGFKIPVVARSNGEVPDARWLPEMSKRESNSLATANW